VFIISGITLDFITNPSSIKVPERFTGAFRRIPPGLLTFF
jgi:hypothetical protein